MVMKWKLVSPYPTFACELLCTKRILDEAYLKKLLYPTPYDQNSDTGSVRYFLLFEHSMETGSIGTSIMLDETILDNVNNNIIPK